MGSRVGGLSAVVIRPQARIRLRQNDREFWGDESGRKARIKSKPKIRMGETVIEPAFSMKYLGVIIDRGLL